VHGVRHIDPAAGPRRFLREIAGHPVSGRIILLGLIVTLAGIVVVAWAGAKKDGDLSPEQKKKAVAEFDFKKGIAVAVFSGIMSACFAFGLSAGEPVKALSAAAGTGPLWTGLPTLCLVMFGGLITNGLWCAWLIFRNRSAGQWLGAVSPAEAADKPETAALKRSPLLVNLPAVRRGRHGLVLPVLLLHDGREPDGPVRLLQLDPPHGLDHHLRHPVGLRLPRMEGRKTCRQEHGMGRRWPPHSGDDRHRLWQLYCDLTDR
jgi:hypothetical protein